MKIVKCIDNTGNAKNLLPDTEYGVAEERNGLFLIGKDWWAKSRFEKAQPCECCKTLKAKLRKVDILFNCIEGAMDGLWRSEDHGSKVNWRQEAHEIYDMIDECKEKIK